ncbi:MAG: hypothetical protein GY816_18930 [Cytophagales bacterium]|nr:hypothetical protein [Cytophagales bacterium]
MTKQTYKLRIDLSGDMYRAEDGVHECHFSLFTEPSKGILVWEEFQEKVQVQDSILTVILGTNRPVFNLIWVYQALWLHIELSNHDHKIAFRSRFKIVHRAEKAVSS